MASTEQVDVSLWDELTPVRFLLYFATLGISIHLSLKGAFASYKAANAQFPFVCRLLCLLAIGAAAWTWYLIISFFVQDAERYASWYEWMLKGDYFVGAYVAVIDTDPKWWFSSQLLTFVCAMVVMMNAEGWRRSSPWYFVAAITGFGFFGAISAALPMFFVYLLGPKTTKKSTSASTLVSVPLGVTGIFLMGACSAVGLASVAVMRESPGAALAVLHLILYLPAWFRVVFSSKPIQRDTISTSLQTIYVLVAVASYVHHMSLTNSVWVLCDGSIEGLSQTLVSQGLPPGNPCQLSISSDVLFTTIACFLYFLASGSLFEALGFLVFTPVISLGASFSTTMFFREMEGDSLEEVELDVANKEKKNE